MVEVGPLELLPLLQLLGLFVYLLQQVLVLLLQEVVTLLRGEAHAGLRLLQSLRDRDQNVGVDFVREFECGVYGVSEVLALRVLLDDLEHDVVVRVENLYVLRSKDHNQV